MSALSFHKDQRCISPNGEANSTATRNDTSGAEVVGGLT
jgi:hypothetical protein